MPHVTVCSKKQGSASRISSSVESETPVAPGIRLATPHLRANRCGDLLRRFHPFGEMLEARHLHSNEHPVEGMFLQTFCSMPQGH